MLVDSSRVTGWGIKTEYSAAIVFPELSGLLIALVNDDNIALDNWLIAVSKLAGLKLNSNGSVVIFGKLVLFENPRFEKLNEIQKVNTLSMISPVTNEEKQKLLEALTIKDKIDTLENIISFYLHNVNFNNQTIQ